MHTILSFLAQGWLTSEASEQSRMRLIGLALAVGVLAMTGIIRSFLHGRRYARHMDDREMLRLAERDHTGRPRF